MFHLQAIHHDDNDYPLAPESVKISKDDLSPYAKGMLRKLGVCCETVKKLLTIPSMHDKHKYVKKLGQRVTHNTPIYSKRGIRYKEIQRN